MKHLFPILMAAFLVEIAPWESAGGLVPELLLSLEKPYLSFEE